MDLRTITRDGCQENCNSSSQMTDDMTCPTCAQSQHQFPFNGTSQLEEPNACEDPSQYCNPGGSFCSNTTITSEKYIKRLPKGLKFVHININGLKSKFSDVNDMLINEENILVFGITETKLQDHTNSKELSIDNYNMFRYDREGREGGGSAFYVHNSCLVNDIDLPDGKPEYVEFNAVKLVKEGLKRTIICLVYCPPNLVNDAFLEYFTKVCHLLSSQNYELIIYGDFNINLLVNNSNKFKLVCTTKEYNLTQKVNFPTRIASRINENSEVLKSQTLIDHIYTNQPEKYNCGGMNFGGSDHHLVFLVKQSKVKCPPRTIEFRAYKNLNKEVFSNDIVKINWDFLKNPNVASHNALIFEKQVVALLEQYAPLKTKTIKGNNVPWYNTEVKKMSRIRDKLQNISIKEPSVANIRKYKKAKNAATSSLRHARKRYFRGKFEESSKSESVWNTFNEITRFRRNVRLPIAKLINSEGKDITENEDICNLLSN